MSELKNTAPAQAAGYILQLERALNHLAHAGPNAAVAVEYVDDVVVIRDGKVVIQEQDKSSAKRNTDILPDRSKALWRTLQIWLSQRSSAGGQACERFLFFVNNPILTPVATLMKARSNGKATASQVVAGLRLAGSGRPGTKIQALIDDVLSRSDADLEALIELVEIVEEGDTGTDRTAMANSLGLNPRANVDEILEGLFGWLTSCLRAAWREGRPGVITRKEILAQSFALQSRQARSRLLPRASSEVRVAPADREHALARPFVEHLGRIDAEDEDIIQAVDHFLKFNVEKHRLVREGEIADAEWLHRGERLKERWSGIMRRRRRELQGHSPSEIDQTVLADATYDYREALDGQPCDELYMTSGHYHRLADEDDVWWDPNYSAASTHED